ncbi:MAG: hypothetical protein JXP34_27885 [Planctomycetes bacterium]|nr:hypothetical protein [Planctomycetota bacterium]
MTIVDDPAKEELKKQLTRIAEARKTAIPLTIVKDDDKIAPLKLRKDTPVVVIAYSKVKVVDKMVFDAEQWKSLSDEKIKEMIARFKKALIGTS